MKIRTMVLWLAVLALSASALAQTGPPAKRPAQRANNPLVQLTRVAQHLNLTEEQRTQFRTLLQGAQEQIKTVRADTTLTSEQKRDKVQQIVQQTRISFSALLTPEQQARLLGMARGRGPMAGMARLNLTDDQKALLKPLFEKQRQDVRAIRQNTTLTPEQKREQIQTLRQETHKQFLAVLTADQLKLWEQMHHRRGGMPR